MSTYFSCSYMSLSSSLYLLSGFSVKKMFSVNLYRLGRLWEKKNIKIFCSEICSEMIFDWLTLKSFVTPPFSINFRSQIETRWAISGSCEALGIFMCTAILWNLWYWKSQKCSLFYIPPSVLFSLRLYQIAEGKQNSWTTKVSTYIFLEENQNNILDGLLAF